MSLPELLLQHLTDPFRIGLLIALIITMLRTRAATGTVVPLGLGAVFVAVIIPMTSVQPAVLPLWQVVVVGLAANVLLLAILMLAWVLYQRLRG